MFQGMTLGEQRTLLALAVVIALGLGAQTYRDRQERAPLVLQSNDAVAAPTDGTVAGVQTFYSAQGANTASQAAVESSATPAPPQSEQISQFASIGPLAPPHAPGGSAALMDLNRASLADLDSLPGVGQVRAQAIVDYRTRAGGFRSVDDLLAVDGIGEKTLETLRPLVTVSP